MFLKNNVNVYMKLRHFLQIIVSMNYFIGYYNKKIKNNNFEKNF